MRKIVYYVSSSLDGFIAGDGGDISQFLFEGKGVEKYVADLACYDTVIMGRKTYEFGYAYGLEKGQPAYQNMMHHIFSNSLKFENQHESVIAEPLEIERIKSLKSVEGSDIYLCGGGEFAGWLLDYGMIDVLKIKLNPIVLGSGTKLFGSTSLPTCFSLEGKESFDDGMLILTYKLK